MHTRKVRDQIVALKPKTLHQVLALIFSKSLEEGELLADWRSANVTPIFRKGAKSENYIPVVSLTNQYRVQNHGVHCEILNYGPPRGEQPDEPQSLYCTVYMQPTRTSVTSITAVLVDYCTVHTHNAQYLEFNVCTVTFKTVGVLLVDPFSHTSSP